MVKKTLLSVFALVSFACVVLAQPRAGYLSDIHAVSVVEPAPDTTLPDRRTFVIIGSFENTGTQDLYDVPLRAEIRRCSDKTLVFQSDTTTEAILVDSGSVNVRFPVTQAGWTTRSLQAGCYRIAVIARQGDDGDRSNDTAYAQVTLSRAPLPDDIGCDSILAPIYEQRRGFDTIIHVVARIVNGGQNAASNQTVRLSVRDLYSNAEILRDSVNITTLPPGASVPVQFVGFMPRPSTYRVTVATSLANDAWRFDDTAHSVFRIGYADQAVALIRPVVPARNENIPLGTAWQPTARLRWVGYQPPRSMLLEATVIDDAKNIERYSSSLQIQATDWTSDSITVTWPSTSYYGNLDRLSRGFYSAILNHDTIGFQLGIPVHDSSIAAICSIYAADSAQVPLNREVDMYYRFRNSGFDTIRHVQCWARIADCNGNIVYSDSGSIDAIWPPSRNREVSFKPFYPPSRTLYTLQCAPIFRDERWPSDDTSTIHLVVGYPLLRVDTIVTPAFGATIPAGTRFDPSVRIIPYPAFTPYRNLPLEFEIIDSETQQLYFLLDTVLAVIPSVCSATEIRLPGVTSDYDVRQLPAGTYNAIATVFDSAYLDLFHMRTVSTFYITPNGRGIPTASNRVDQPSLELFPNPCDGELTVRYTLAARASVQFSVRDMLGRVVFAHSDESVPTGEQRRTLTLPPLSDGIYVLTVSARETSGIVHSEARTISVVHASAR